MRAAVVREPKIAGAIHRDAVGVPFALRECCKQVRSVADRGTGVRYCEAQYATVRGIADVADVSGGIERRPVQDRQAGQGHRPAPSSSAVVGEAQQATQWQYPFGVHRRDPECLTRQRRGR